MRVGSSRLVASIRGPRASVRPRRGGTMAIESTTTTSDRTSKGPDDMSWRPMQRSTRVAVFAALAVTLFYMIFLLNPAYRGNTWVWVLVLFAEGITIFNALAMWWTVLVHTPHPDPPEVYAWR